MTEPGKQATPAPLEDAEDNSDESAVARALGPLRELVRTSGPGRFFGNYELLAVLGVGGQGVVYRARQMHVGKLVALKLVNPDDRESSLRELTLVSDLEHPHLVRVYHVGEHDGWLYYTMQLAEKGSLDRPENFASHRLQPATNQKSLAADHRRLAGFMTGVARAVGHLHRKGVVHRDLKPGNVLIAANGEPLVTDLGLAWRLGETGAGGGTLPYMAPEQMRGESNLKPSADVYSLGVILFKLLAGRLPFEGPSDDDIRAQVCGDTSAPSPCSINGDVGLASDLSLICGKCLEKDPARRYADADLLADDLECAVNGERISLRQRHWLCQLGVDGLRAVSSIPPHSQRELLRWSGVDLADALLIALYQGVIYFLVMAGASVVWVWLALLVFLVLWWSVFLHYTLNGPVTPRERNLLWIWAIVYLGEATLLLALCPPWLGLSAASVLPLYPAWTVMTGMGFFVIGRAFWGRYYLVGLAHFLVALLMPIDLSLAPLVYALLNGVCMTWQGVEYRLQANKPDR